MFAWSMLSFLITSAYHGNIRALLIAKTHGHQINTFQDVAERGYEWTLVTGNLPGASRFFPQNHEIEAALMDTYHLMPVDTTPYQKVKSACSCFLYNKVH